MSTLSADAIALVRRFTERLMRDPVLTVTLSHFEGLPWEEVDGGVERDAGRQILRIEKDQIITIMTDGMAGGIRQPL
ncbi:hypothetical protein ABNQ39_00130 (plasmid) [Azospirillum sp. A26]|uniref:hypothetical protein n=1 Tax=Azospirillum sp. A26 TaxID=3160607 RepID=UPI00366FF947